MSLSEGRQSLCEALCRLAVVNSFSSFFFFVSFFKHVGQNCWDPILHTDSCFCNIQRKPIDAPFPEGEIQDTHTHIQQHAHKHTDQQNGINIGFAFVSALWKNRKDGCENVQAEEKKLRMRCAIQPHHRGLRQLGDRECLPIVHICPIYTHKLDIKQAVLRQSSICCNICQRNVKMSVNWGYFLHLSFTISHLLSSHPRMWWGSIYTRFCDWGSSQQPYAGATRGGSKTPGARITFCFFFCFVVLFCGTGYSKGKWINSPINNYDYYYWNNINLMFCNVRPRLLSVTIPLRCVGWMLSQIFLFLFLFIFWHSSSWKWFWTCGWCWVILKCFKLWHTYCKIILACLMSEGLGMCEFLWTKNVYFSVTILKDSRCGGKLLFAFFLSIS